MYLNFNLNWIQNQQFLILRWVKEKKILHFRKFSALFGITGLTFGSGLGVVDLGNQKGRVEKFLYFNKIFLQGMLKLLKISSIFGIRVKHTWAVRLGSHNETNIFW